MGLVKCSHCKRRLKKDRFYKDKSNKNKLRYICKYCDKVRIRKSKLKNPDVYRTQKYKHRYGITTEERNQMLIWQNGKCAICRIKENGKRLCVDHDHKTGQIGMLLCNECNLGRSCRDNIIITSAYLEYLKTYHA